jgi:hypothetical protein
MCLGNPTCHTIKDHIEPVVLTDNQRCNQMFVSTNHTAAFLNLERNADITHNFFWDLLKLLMYFFLGYAEITRRHVFIWNLLKLLVYFFWDLFIMEVNHSWSINILPLVSFIHSKSPNWLEAWNVMQSVILSLCVCI